MDYEGKFVPLLFVRGIPLVFYVAQASDFCVFGFAFLSGYAHFLLSDKPDFYRKRIKGLFLLLCSYWLILLVFSTIGLITGHGDYMPGNASQFIANMFLINSYCGAWWYLQTYVLLVLLSPVLVKIVRKYNTGTVLIIGFLIYSISYYARFHVYAESALYEKLGCFGMTFFEYMGGAVALKHKIFSKMYRIWNRISSRNQCGIAAIIVTCILLTRTLCIQSLFVAPVSGFMIMTLFHFWHKPSVIRTLFILVGKHSMNIWLTHMFFYLSMFKNMVYKVNYVIPIMLYMMLVTIAVSYGLKKIENFLRQLLTVKN